MACPSSVGHLFSLLGVVRRESAFARVFREHVATTFSWRFALEVRGLHVQGRLSGARMPSPHGGTQRRLPHGCPASARWWSAALRRHPRLGCCPALDRLLTQGWPKARPRRRAGGQRVAQGSVCVAASVWNGPHKPVAPRAGWVRLLRLSLAQPQPPGPQVLEDLSGPSLWGYRHAGTCMHPCMHAAVMRANMHCVTALVQRFHVVRQAALTQHYACMHHACLMHAFAHTQVHNDRAKTARPGRCS